MTTTTSDQQLIIPSNSDVNDVVTHFSSYTLGSSNNGAESRLVKRYASAADRTTRNATPNEGELSYLMDVNEIDSYDGAAWQYVWSTRMPRGIMATPITTATQSSGFGATEAQDTNLGTYTFTAVAGRRYQVVLNNAYGSSGSIGDTYFLRVRDGGAGAPTNTSTIVGESLWRAATAFGNEPIPRMEATFTTTSGTHNLGLFMVRVSGSNTAFLGGINSQTNGHLFRELYVADIGNV